MHLTSWWLPWVSSLNSDSFPSLVQASTRVSAPSLLSYSFSQKEQEKSEKVSKRVSAVEEVRSHVKVLQEMLSMYRRPGQALPDQEALQVIFRCNTGGCTCLLKWVHSAFTCVHPWSHLRVKMVNISDTSPDVLVLLCPPFLSPLLPNPRAATDLLSLLICWQLPDSCINGMMQYITLYFCLASQSHSRSIHVAVCSSSLFLLIARYCPITWMYHSVYLLMGLALFPSLGDYESHCYKQLCTRDFVWTSIFISCW